MSLNQENKSDDKNDDHLNAAQYIICVQLDFGLNSVHKADIWGVFDPDWMFTKLTIHGVYPSHE